MGFRYRNKNINLSTANALGVFFNNLKSKLKSNNVQDAIDEVKEITDELNSNLSTLNFYAFTKTIDSGGWRDVGTITLKKGVYIISANYVFTASVVDGLRGCYLANNVAWNGPYIMDVIRATGYTGKNQPTKGSMSACVEVLEDTIVTVKSIQDAGVNLTSDVSVSIVKLA